MPDKIVPQSREERMREYKREYARRWRAKNPERSRANVRNSRNRHPEGVRQRARKYYAKNREKVIARTSNYKKRNKEKHAAHFAVTLAIWKGKLVRPNRCEKCGKECKPQAHHHKGYAPESVLDVVWLCVRCHSAADKAMRGALPATLPAS